MKNTYKVLTSIIFVSLLAAGCSQSTDQNNNSQPTATPTAMQATPTPSSMTSPTVTVTPKPSPTPTVKPTVIVPVSRNVSIQSFSFSSPVLTIKKGTTVTWTNQDQTAHTVTGDNGGPNSPSLASGDSYSYQFNNTGTFSYHCKFHSSMQATVIVK